jgi:hypothetical protein
MASGLQFITFNPASAAYNEGQDRTERRRAQDLQMRRGEFDLSEAQRQSAENQGVDAAIREGLTPPAAPRPQAPAPGPVDQVRGQGEGRIESAPLPPTQGQPAAAPQAAAAPQQRVGTQVANRLAQTPGGGRAALALRQGDERQRDEAETRAFHYLSNPATAHLGLELANKIGMPVPPQLANNTAFWQGTAIAKQLYPDDPAAGQKFVSAFVQGGGGDVQASTQAGVQAAGVPPKRRRYGTVQGDDGIVFYDLENPQHQIAGPQRTQGQYVTGNDGNMLFLRQGRTQAEPVTGVDGQPLAAQRFGAARGAQASVFQQKQQAWLAANPGDVQGALAYASGTKQVDPATELRIASGIAKVELGNAPDPLLSTPAQREAYQRSLQARAQEIVQGWRQQQPGGQAPQPGAARPPQAAPQPGAPPPMAAPAMPAVGGTRESPAMPQTEDEFNALPSGSVYVDPDDGILYVKP